MTKHTRTACLVTSIAMTLVPASAALIADSTEGRTWYVGTSGTDAVHGGFSEALPFRTIKRAIDVAQDGDTIQIAAGTYYPQNTLDIGGPKGDQAAHIINFQSIHFVGAVDENGDPATIISGSGGSSGSRPIAGLFYITHNHFKENQCTFSNLVLQEAQSRAIWSWGTAIISNSVIRNNELRGLYGENFMVDHSIFEGNEFDIVAMGDVWVEDCDFLGGEWGISLFEWYEDQDDVWPDYAEIRNCFFTQYDRSAVKIYREHSALLENLDIRDNPGDGIQANSRTQIVDCVISSNGGSGIVTDNEYAGAQYEGTTEEGCRIDSCTITNNGAFGIEDLGGDMLDTTRNEGMEVSNSVICGNHTAQVFGGFYLRAGTYDYRRQWNHDNQESLHWFNYWKGTNNNVSRRCSVPGRGNHPMGPNPFNW